MTPEEYEARREARYQRLLAAADRADVESSASYKHADAMASVIPFGQPILVGHYSEGRDRRYRDRIHAKMRRGYELHKKAERLRARAEAAHGNRAIFSDDPLASEKLEEKIAKLEKRQAMMREANKFIRANNQDGLLDMGFSETTIMRLFQKDFAGRIGFADYELTNNSANIRRLKKRLADVTASASEETTERVIGVVRIIDNVEENRLQLMFPDKPSHEIRIDLKSHGFRWSPTAGMWQRHRSASATWAAEQVIKKHYAIEEVER